MWFVPSANATNAPQSDNSARSAQQHTAAEQHDGPLDPTRCLMGGAVFLGLGTASVAIVRRRTPTA